MNLIQGLITGVLAIALPLVPMVAQAPEVPAPEPTPAFYPAGDEGFSFRWVDEETAKAEGLECNLYNWCAFVDIVGPVCPNEIYIELDFFAKGDVYATSDRNVLPAGGRQRHLRVELGSNLYEGLDTFRIYEIRCYQGLPTGTPNL